MITGLGKQKDVCQALVCELMFKLEFPFLKVQNTVSSGLCTKFWHQRQSNRLGLVIREEKKVVSNITTSPFPTEKLHYRHSGGSPILCRWSFKQSKPSCVVLTTSLCCKGFPWCPPCQSKPVDSLYSLFFV